MTSNSPKVVTRSHSSSSAKSLKSSTSAPVPLSVDDFHKTMAEFQKTQGDTLMQCKLLSESQSTKFAELTESISLLSAQVVVLKDENGVLRNNLNDLSKRVQALESTHSSNPTSTANIIPTLLHEMSERERFSRNVIIRGIPESTSAILGDRISSDATKIAEALQPYFPALPTDIKSIRLGKPSVRGPRP